MVEAYRRKFLVEASYRIAFRFFCDFWKALFENRGCDARMARESD